MKLTINDFTIKLLQKGLGKDIKDISINEFVKSNNKSNDIYTYDITYNYKSHNLYTIFATADNRRLNHEEIKTEIKKDVQKFEDLLNSEISLEHIKYILQAKKALISKLHNNFSYLYKDIALERLAYVISQYMKEENIKDFGKIYEKFSKINYDVEEKIKSLGNYETPKFKDFTIEKDFVIKYNHHRLKELIIKELQKVPQKIDDYLSATLTEKFQLTINFYKSKERNISSAEIINDKVDYDDLIAQITDIQTISNKDSDKIIVQYNIPYFNYSELELIQYLLHDYEVLNVLAYMYQASINKYMIDNQYNTYDFKDCEATRSSKAIASRRNFVSVDYLKSSQKDKKDWDLTISIKRIKHIDLKKILEKKKMLNLSQNTIIEKMEYGRLATKIKTPEEAMHFYKVIEANQNEKEFISKAMHYIKIELDKSDNNEEIDIGLKYFVKKILGMEIFDESFEKECKSITNWDPDWMNFQTNKSTVNKIIEGVSDFVNC